LRIDSNGFTLIEVLVAFAILALTLIVLLQVFGTGLRTVDASERYLMATMLARSVLDDLGVETPVVPGERSGEIGDGYRWTMQIAPSRTIAPVGSGDQRQVPYEVTVEISLNGRPVTTLTTLRLAQQSER
jgi:general secretion pathway protein I